MMHYNDLPLLDVTKKIAGKETVIGQEIDPKKLDDIEFPIKFMFKKAIGKSITETEIREPTIGDIESAQKEDTELKQNKKLLTLVASNLSPETVDEIVPRDFTKLLTVITPFLG